VLAIKQVSSRRKMLIFAYALAAIVQKLQPLHAWAGDGLMMFLLCHCRSLPQLARPQTCNFLMRYCSVLMKVKNNTWMQLMVRTITLEPIPSFIAPQGTPIHLSMRVFKAHAHPQSSGIHHRCCPCFVTN
jgi:hypothetical protein